MNLPNLELKNKYVLILAPFLLLSVVLAFAVYPLFHDKVYDGILLDGVDVSGKSKAQLTEMLQQWNDKCQDKIVKAYYSDKQFSIRASDVGFSIDIEATVYTVWSYGRVGSWWNRINSIRIASSGKTQNLPLRISYSQELLDNVVLNWKQKLERPPRNASLSLATGGIIPEESGMRLLQEEMKSSLLRAFYSEDSKYVAIPVIAVEPKVTLKSLRDAGIVEMQSIYSTKFNDEDVKRSINIKLAAEKINGCLLQPGQIFSFNDVVGPRDKASGFQEALEFFDGELVPGIGGGVCQVSSTLYNAALLANLEIKERLNHAKPLSYVGLGRDATVAYGVLDFKFVNSSASPVMIVSEVKNDTLYVAIFGRERIKEHIEIVTTDIKEIKPVTVKKPDPELPAGETKLENKGAPGYDLKVYRVVTLGGKILKREFLSKDQYLADNIIVKVGVKPKQTVPVRK